MTADIDRPAPELQVAHWLNTPHPLSLAQLRGRVVVVEAFQMLCPGCVHHGLPQAERVAQSFSSQQVVVIGLHTVFEHHEVQGTLAALQAFVHENRMRYPVALDRPGHPLPATMTAYAMQGTPTLLLVDAQGILRAQHFGSVSDLALGAHIGALVAQAGSSAQGRAS
jgi:thiol-disulfide isomerase/thioredoxin